MSSNNTQTGYLGAACTCCSDMPHRHTRRQFLTLSGAATLAMFAPKFAMSATGNYEAMLLSCIDPRFQKPVFDNESKQGLTGKYSAFTIAGASIGVVAPAFKDWHETFWQNLAASVQLHNINQVIVINHRDCGAAKIAYGDAAVSTPEIETETHKKALLEFKSQLAQRQPKLKSQLGLMALDGSLATFS